MNAAEDRTIVGEGTINHYWMVCFADEATRKRQKLKYISQMRTANPYWYIWFEDMPGVFKLDMISCKQAPDWDWHAYFLVKYYPHPKEAAFEGLSILEQVCRMSEVFQTRPAQWKPGETGCVCHGGVHHHGVRFEELANGTGVPDICKSAELPQDFFLAGQMELFHREGLKSEVVWESQDHWRVKMTEDYYMPDQSGTTLKILRRGDVDRDFPGWLLTDFIAQRFAAGWQEHNGFMQSDESSEQHDGLDFNSDGRSLNANVSKELRRLLVRRRMQQ